MPSNRKLREKILRQMKALDGALSSSGDPILALQHKLKIDGGANNARQYRDVVSDMIKKGELVLSQEETARSIKTVAPKPKQQPRPPRHLDRTERSPQAKREAVHAKGYSAYLRDDQVGPLTVTKLGAEIMEVSSPKPSFSPILLRPKREEAAVISAQASTSPETTPEVIESVKTQATSSAQQSKLEQALSVVCAFFESDKKAEIHSRLIRDAIMEELGCGRVVANAYIRQLRDQEILCAYGPKTSMYYHLPEHCPTALAVDKPGVVESSKSPKSAQTESDAQANDTDVARQLAGIIVVLEKRLEERTSQLTETEAEVASLRGELATCQHTVAELQAKLEDAKAKPAVDPLVYEVLMRHAK